MNSEIQIKLLKKSGLVRMTKLHMKVFQPEYNFSISLGYKNAKRQTALKDISIIENLDYITDPENSLTYLG